MGANKATDKCCISSQLCHVQLSQLSPYIQVQMSQLPAPFQAQHCSDAGARRAVSTVSTVSTVLTGAQYKMVSLIEVHHSQAWKGTYLAAARGQSDAANSAEGRHQTGRCLWWQNV